MPYKTIHNSQCTIKVISHYSTWLFWIKKQLYTTGFIPVRFWKTKFSQHQIINTLFEKSVQLTYETLKDADCHTCKRPNIIRYIVPFIALLDKVQSKRVGKCSNWPETCCSKQCLQSRDLGFKSGLLTEGIHKMEVDLPEFIPRAEHTILTSEMGPCLIR